MDLVYPPVIMAAYGSFTMLNLKIDLQGGGNVPTKGGAVLASNHVSYLDFIFCGFACRPSKRLVRFMAKKSTFDNVVSGPLMRSMHHIPVDRSAGANAYATAVERLKAGEMIGVFPEATISESFELKGFKSGAARMAVEAGVPLIPMVTFGGHRLWTKGRPRNLERGVAVSLRVGEPLNPGPDDDLDEVMAEIKTRMGGLLDQTLDAYPQRPPDGTWWWPARLGGGAPTPEAVEAARQQRSRDRGRSESAPDDE